VDQFDLNTLSHGGGAVVDGDLMSWINMMHLREWTKLGTGPEFELIYHQAFPHATLDQRSHIVDVMQLLKERVRLPVDFATLG
jgi:hypothetical protein